MIDPKAILKEIITQYNETGWLPESINVSPKSYESISPNSSNGVGLWLGWGIGASVRVLPDSNLSDDEYKLVGFKSHA